MSCNGFRVSFLGVKRPGLCVDQPPLSSAEVKETELYLCSFSASSWSVLGEVHLVSLVGDLGVDLRTALVLIGE